MSCSQIPKYHKLWLSNWPVYNIQSSCARTSPSCCNTNSPYLQLNYWSQEQEETKVSTFYACDLLQPSITSNSWAQTETAKEPISSFAAMKSIEPVRTVELVEPSLVGLVPGSGMLITIPSRGNSSISPMPAEIPPPSLPAINTSRSSQGYHKEPQGDLANERIFCISWPWLDAHHVGIETTPC